MTQLVTYTIHVLFMSISVLLDEDAKLYVEIGTGEAREALRVMGWR